MELSFQNLLYLWCVTILVIMFGVLMWRRHPVAIRGEFVNAFLFPILILFGITRSDRVVDWWASLEFSSTKSTAVMSVLFLLVGFAFFLLLRAGRHRNFFVFGLGPDAMEELMHEELRECDPSLTRDGIYLIAHAYDVKILYAQSWAGFYRIAFRGDRSQELSEHFFPTFQFRLQDEPFSFYTKRVLTFIKALVILLLLASPLLIPGYWG